MAEKILEVCKVTPLPMSSSDMCIPLSFFDLIWLRLSPIEVLFFYEAPHLPENFLLRLKNSLSLTLQHFVPLSGNLEWPPSSPNPMICYKKGDGVLFTVSQSDADFSHLSSRKFRETKIFKSFLAEITDSESQVPLLAIKVTIFPNKGFCIGITQHHVAFDGAVFSMFTKAWSSFCKFGENSNLNSESALVFERNSIRERYQKLEALYINHMLDQDVANPRSLAIMRAESPPDRVRVCTVKAKARMENKVGFSIVVDCRARLALPPNYGGNCIGFVGGYVERDELMGDFRMVAAVKAVQKILKNLDEVVLTGAEKWIEPLKTDVISLAGFTNMEVYNRDFGWGGPTKVDIASIDKTSAISLVQGRDGRGEIEMELSLSKNEMEKFAFAFADGLNKLKHIKSAL